MNVAFIGLGSIGRPMAVHLARPPFTLVVWNRTASRSTSFAAEQGVRAANSAADAARGATVVVTCLSTSSDVASLLDGDEGLLAGLDRGATLVDCTSGDPAGSQRIAARLAERGVAYIDAPVSGGVAGAVKGALTVMCGGDASAIERVRPVLDSFGSRVVHCGPVGAGAAVKAVNNALLAVHIWAAGEGLTTLAKMGISPKTALDVINTSSGRSNVSENLFTERVIGRRFPRTFRLALLDKDIGIAAQVAREQKVATPLLQLTAEMFRLAHGALGEEADHVEAVKIVEGWAGQEIV
ncbi:MAG: NAD(P)-dependent oxidoreductase [Gemmatimonadaceae bacterium]